MQCPHRWPPGRPAAIPITYRHRARGRPACLCAAVPMAGFAQSPNARIPEVPDAGRSLREIESTARIRAPARSGAAGRLGGAARAGTIRRSRWRRTAACARLPAAGQSPRRHRRAAGAARRPERQRAGPGRRARPPTVSPATTTIRGYLLARLSSAAGNPRRRVDIAVQEGVYDEIQLDNRSRVSDAVLRRGLSVLRPGDPVHIDNLESRCA